MDFSIDDILEIKKVFEFCAYKGFVNAIKVIDTISNGKYIYDIDNVDNFISSCHENTIDYFFNKADSVDKDDVDRHPVFNKNKLFAYLLMKGALEGDKFYVNCALDSHSNLDEINKSYNNDDYSPIIAAVYGRNIEILKILMKRGVKGNLNKAIVLASDGGQYDIVDYLIKEGVSIESRRIEREREDGECDNEPVKGRHAIKFDTII